MRRALVVLLCIVLLCIVLLAGLAAAVVPSPTPPAVYSLAQVQEGRRGDPAAWTGRVVSVRGWLGGIRLGYSTGPKPTDERFFRWDVIEPGPRGRGNTDYADPLTTCRQVAPRLTPLVLTRAPGVHWPPPGAGEAPGGSPLLRLVSRVPVVGGLVPPSATHRGIVFRLRLLPPHRCTIIRAIGIARPYPDAILLGYTS